MSGCKHWHQQRERLHPDNPWICSDCGAILTAPPAARPAFKPTDAEMQAAGIHPANPQRGHFVHAARFGMLWFNGERWCLIVDVQEADDATRRL